VPAEGERTARLVVVGEAPGPQEDQRGRPFVGRAGKILRESLSNASVDEKDVWITNAVKCFPHERVDDKRQIRAPSPSEAQACRNHLRRELDVVRPRLIVALGRTAAQQLLGAKVTDLESLRGTLQRTRGELGDHRVLVTYHPSGLHYETGRRERFEDDLRKARRLIEAPKA
jgi:DNA polymerase